MSIPQQIRRPDAPSGEWSLRFELVDQLRPTPQDAVGMAGDVAMDLVGPGDDVLAYPIPEIAELPLQKVAYRVRAPLGKTVELSSPLQTVLEDAMLGLPNEERLARYSQERGRPVTQAGFESAVNRAVRSTGSKTLS